MEEQNLNHSWRHKKVHTFCKRISSEVNVLVQLEFELTYHVSLDVTETLPINKLQT